MDIKPVRRPTQNPGQPNQPPRPLQPVQPPQPPLAQPPIPPIAEAPAPQPINSDDSGIKKVRKRKKLLIIIASLIALLIITAASLWVWYQVELSPANAKNDDKVRVEIEAASTPDEIATVLKDKGVIRSKPAFLWYTRLSGVQNSLQAGDYMLTPSESTPQVVEHLVKGSVDTFTITFYPGATLVDKVTKPENRKDVTSVLEKAGFTDAEIAAALGKTYDHPLFQDKPATADLEGYIFGETYQFNTGVSVEDVLTRTFDEFYKWVVQYNLVSAYKDRGLSLYQGITLASIVQRESGGDDKAQIAQVFYSRLAINMQLGSDVTYQYIADKTGVTRDPSLDSPYNTRRYAGLPPGPIAVPGLAALRAVAMPASGDYLYFLSGDDHVTYYARTLDEHEANIVNHCLQKCQII
ncbi:MAG: putative Aminodeoxychorismate lyase [Candidatus Saccharibacteria bacterium]|nr:putative Aminodeoxychorismate lyase [Candidatus Saccharibacteria bacterium]